MQSSTTNTGSSAGRTSPPSTLEVASSSRPRRPALTWALPEEGRRRCGGGPGGGRGSLAVASAEAGLCFPEFTTCGGTKGRRQGGCCASEDGRTTGGSTDMSGFHGRRIRESFLARSRCCLYSGASDFLVATTGCTREMRVSSSRFSLSILLAMRRRLAKLLEPEPSAASTPASCAKPPLATPNTSCFCRFSDSLVMLQRRSTSRIFSRCLSFRSGSSFALRSLVFRIFSVKHCFSAYSSSRASASSIGFAASTCCLCSHWRR